MPPYTERDLKASVGRYGKDKQCYNTTSDQQMVQDLLNRVGEDNGGTDGKLETAPRWGVVSDELHQAILRFQKAHVVDEGLLVDGHVDPFQRTLRALLKYPYRILRFYPPTENWIPPHTPDPIDTGPAVTIGSSGLTATSWRLEGSFSVGVSGLVVVAGTGHFNLRRDGVSFPYKIGYVLGGAGLSPLPVSVSVGPESAPQAGTRIWTFKKKDLDFQDLIGPMLVLQGTVALWASYTGSAVWFNAPLGVGLAARIIASAGADKLLEQLTWLNKSAGGVAFIRGGQISTPDLSTGLLTGLGWPNNS